MKKIIISITVLVLAILFGIFLFKNLTTEKTYYEYTEFDKIPNIVNENKKVIIFLVQDGCSSCKLVEPIVNDYAKENKGVVYCIVQNKDEDFTKEVEKYHIEGTPTLIYYKTGNEVQRTKGGFTDTEFRKMIKKADF